jgi:hypothetical protein
MFNFYCEWVAYHLICMQKFDRKNILIITPDQSYCDSLVQNVNRVTMELPFKAIWVKTLASFDFVNRLYVRQTYQVNAKKFYIWITIDVRIDT